MIMCILHPETETHMHNFLLNSPVIEDLLLSIGALHMQYQRQRKEANPSPPLMILADAFIHFHQDISSSVAAFHFLQPMEEAQEPKAAWQKGLGKIRLYLIRSKSPLVYFKNKEYQSKANARHYLLRKSKLH